MENKQLETALEDLFETSGNIADTIWYSPYETLYDAIIRVIEANEIIDLGALEND